LCRIHGQLSTHLRPKVGGEVTGDKFFAILDEGRLFFKTDAAGAADYTARGMGAFTYESKGKVLTMAFQLAASSKKSVKRTKPR
jgi:TfoX/Sxy family transcriptional regulator of competence genes